MQAFYSLHFCATDSRARIWTVKAQAVQHIWTDTGFACLFIYSGTLHLSDRIDTMETVNDTNVETAARVEQISGKNCDAGLIAKGIDRSGIRHYGFAFRGREVLIAGR